MSEAADWRGEEPTKKQLSYLASCGVYWPDKVTRGWVSDMIDCMPSSPFSYSALAEECGREPAHDWQIKWRESVGFPPDPAITKSQAWGEQRDFFERVESSGSPDINYREKAAKEAAQCVGGGSNWREKKPTKKQLDYLASCGVYWPDKVTRGWVSDVVNSRSGCQLLGKWGSEPAHDWQIKWRESVGLSPRALITKEEVAREMREHHELAEGDRRAERKAKEAVWSHSVANLCRAVEHEIAAKNVRLLEIKMLLPKKVKLSAEDSRLVKQYESLSSSLADIETKLLHEKKGDVRKAMEREAERIKVLLDRVDQLDSDSFDAEVLREELIEKRDDVKGAIADLREELRTKTSERVSFWYNVCGGKDWFCENFDCGESHTGLCGAAQLGEYLNVIPPLKKVPPKAIIRALIAGLDEHSQDWDLRDAARNFAEALNSQYPEYFAQPPQARVVRVAVSLPPARVTPPAVIPPAVIPPAVIPQAPRVFTPPTVIPPAVAPQAPRVFTPPTVIPPAVTPQAPRVFTPPAVVPPAAPRVLIAPTVSKPLAQSPRAIPVTAPRAVSAAPVSVPTTKEIQAKVAKINAETERIVLNTVLAVVLGGIIIFAIAIASLSR